MATRNVEGKSSQKNLSIHQRRMEAKRLLANDKFESSFQNTMYKTVSISTIMAKIRFAHAQVGIIMETGALTNMQTVTYSNSVGKKLQQYTCDVPIKLINPDDPSDYCEFLITASAIGIEADDKYVAKLYSSATKIWARMEYAISDVNDKEIDIDSVADYDASTTKPTENYEGVVPKSTFEMTTESTEIPVEQPKQEAQVEEQSSKSLLKPASASEQASDAVQRFKPADSKLKIRVVPHESIDEIKN